MIQSYIALFVLEFIVLIAASLYVRKYRKDIDEMHGMMVGMTFGMIAGLLTATLSLYQLETFCGA